jgi:hypothetical protein
MDNMEKMMQQILARMDADREEEKAYREKMAADRKAYQDQMLADMKAHQAHMDSNRKKMLDSMAKFEEIMDFMKSTLNRQTEAKKIDPGMIKSAEEHQDVRSKDVAVMPVKGLRKRCRGRKSTAGDAERLRNRTEEIVDPAEVGCRLQEGVLPCSSGMAQKETL